MASCNQMMKHGFPQSDTMDMKLVTMVESDPFDKSIDRDTYWLTR